MAAASVCVVTLSEEPGGELTEQAGWCVAITTTVWELSLSHHNSYIKYLKRDAMAKTMTLLNGLCVAEWHHLVSRCETDESKTPVSCNKLSLSACCWCAGFTFSSKYTPIIDLQVNTQHSQIRGKITGESQPSRTVVSYIKALWVTKEIFTVISQQLMA